MIAFLIMLIPVASMSHFQVVGLPFLPIGMFLLVMGCASYAYFCNPSGFLQGCPVCHKLYMAVMFFITPIYFTKELMPQKYEWLIFSIPSMPS